MRRVAFATGLIALFVLAWQGVASLDSVDDLTLASPVETFHALRDDWGLLMDNARVTLVEVVLGLALSVVAGVLFAVSMHVLRPLRDAAYPLLVGSQAVPIVVLSPRPGRVVAEFPVTLPRPRSVTDVAFAGVKARALEALRA